LHIVNQGLFELNAAREKPVRSNSYCGKDADDRYNDHQLYQCKACLFLQQFIFSPFYSFLRGAIIQVRPLCSLSLNPLTK
jgi:hypothetical protein